MCLRRNDNGCEYHVARRAEGRPPRVVPYPGVIPAKAGIQKAASFPRVIPAKAGIEKAISQLPRMIVKRNGLLRTLLIALSVWLMLSGFSFRNPIVEKTKKGNEFFDQQDYDMALQEFRNAQVDDPESPHLFFNIGTALVKQNKFDDAIKELFKVNTPTDPATESKAHYNTGVAQYRQAELELSKNNTEGAVEKLKECIDSNVQAMRLNPDDLDPKYNTEQARKKLKQILDEMKDQQEEQEQQHENQDQQDDQQSDQSEQSQDEQTQQEQQQDEEQQQEQQQNQEQQENGQEEQQAKIGEMSKEDAERILNSLSEEEREALEEFLLRQYGADYPDMRNDW